VANEGGLDDSHGRERIYWGGNLYWLLADVQIRVKTKNRRGLEDVIRAILKAGGNGGADWTIDRVIRVGDKATGTTALKELYEEIGVNRGDIDLDSLWKSLGVVYKNGSVQFDDSAPWASVRKAITALKQG
jgi:predicted metalloprotease with PDZ domain